VAVKRAFDADLVCAVCSLAHGWMRPSDAKIPLWLEIAGGGSGLVALFLHGVATEYFCPFNYCP
jgi:hypothetical protein